ncbi:MAG: F0F1 ATP synthase subunit epsilon [Synechococcus sp.]|nr:F0F1 ATP synthase subunit epsilon [Synechococcus sp.]
MNITQMNLRVMCLTAVLVDEPVRKIVAEGDGGGFCLLPNHVDYVATLPAGIFTFETVAGTERLLAIDEGILVKQGAVVWVSVKNAVRGDDLGDLQRAVRAQFQEFGEQEERARSMLARLESSIVRDFIDLGGAL